MGYQDNISICRNCMNFFRPSQQKFGCFTMDDMGDHMKKYKLPKESECENQTTSNCLKNYKKVCGAFSNTDFTTLILNTAEYLTKDHCKQMCSDRADCLGYVIFNKKIDYTNDGHTSHKPKGTCSHIIFMEENTAKLTYWKGNNEETLVNMDVCIKELIPF